jgi:hypothetical protein
VRYCARCESYVAEATMASTPVYTSAPMLKKDARLYRAQYFESSALLWFMLNKLGQAIIEGSDTGIESIFAWNARYKHLIKLDKTLVR